VDRKIRLLIKGDINYKLLSRLVKSKEIYGYINTTNSIGELEGREDLLESIIEKHNNNFFSRGKKQITFKKIKYIGDLKSFSIVKDKSLVKIKVYIKIYGLFQNSSFETITKRYADKMGIYGWIKRTEDGYVDSKMEGSYDSIYSIIDLISKGFPKTNVENVYLEYLDNPNEFKKFEVIK
jgi:acylphosphatase